MTKEEFKGFSSAGQHDMVLEALVRVTKNLETMEKESGKPFVGTAKQRRNDIKLLTILAEAFGKNELIWDNARVYKNAHAATMDAGKFVSCVDDKSIYPVKSIAKCLDNSGLSRNVVEGFEKISNDRMAKRRSK